MEWESFINSIGARIESDERVTMLDEVEELADAEHASVGLADRIRGSLGRRGTVMVRGERISGEFLDSGADWLIFRHQELLDIIPFHALEDVTGLTVAVAQPTRYCPTLNSVLRRLVNTQVRINRLARVIDGQLRAVGRDYLVVATCRDDIPTVGTSNGVDSGHRYCDRVVYGRDRAGTGYNFGVATADHIHEHYIPLSYVEMISQARPY